jgi:ribosomal-protein-alanine N-acetyltransferase
MLFESERLFVRPFTEADLDNLYSLSSNPVVMRYIRAPISLEACRDLLGELVNGYKAHPHFGRFAVIEKSTQQYAGNFLLRPSSFRGGTEIGYAFLEHAWGKGYATELTKAGLAFAFKHLALEMLYAITEPGNIASQKVLLKCGFVQRSNFPENGKELCLFEIRP